MVVALARASEAALVAGLTTLASEDAEARDAVDLAALFRPRPADYDVLLHLRAAVLPRHFQALDAPVEVNF